MNFFCQNTLTACVNFFFFFFFFFLSPTQSDGDCWKKLRRNPSCIFVNFYFKMAKNANSPTWLAIIHADCCHFNNFCTQHRKLFLIIDTRNHDCLCITKFMTALRPNEKTQIYWPTRRNNNIANNHIMSVNSFTVIVSSSFSRSVWPAFLNVINPDQRRFTVFMHFIIWRRSVLSRLDSAKSRLSVSRSSDWNCLRSGRSWTTARRSRSATNDDEWRVGVCEGKNYQINNNNIIKITVNNLALDLDAKIHVDCVHQ